MSEDEGVCTRAMEAAARAAALIREYGWCQGIYRSREGSYCVMGALESVSSPATPEYWEAKRRLSRVAGLPNDGHVLRWNDAEGRTVKEVLAALDAVAAGGGL